MGDSDLVMDSLEVAAETAGDITGRVYELYYSRCAGSRALMSHVDQYIQGRMMAEVLRLVMTPDPHTQREYLRFEMKSHESYGVEMSMYHDLLTAVRDVVREAMPAAWNADYEAAWGRRLDRLLSEIEVSASDG